MEELLTLVEMPDWKSILLDIVHREGFDPWDIDVGALARAYLERIRQMRELNLKVPANAVLACSILLSMKARRLKEFYADWLPREEDNVVFALDEGEPLVFPESEEQPPDTLTSTPPPRHGRIVLPQRVIPRRLTLDELISAVERVMLAKKKVNRPAPPPPVEELFESIEREPVYELVDMVYRRVIEAAGDDDRVPLSAILPERTPETIVRYLLALLYLANQKKVVLEQESPFGEVHVVIRREPQENS